MQRDSHRDSGLHFRSADSSTLLGFLRASWRDQSTSLEKVAWGTGQRGLHFEKCKFTLLLTKKIVPLTAYVHRDFTTRKAVPSTWRILNHATVHAHVLNHLSRVRLFVTLRTMACHGILQARILEWVACHPPGNLPDPGIEPTSLASPALAGKFSTTASPGKPTGQLYFNEKNYFRTFLVVQWLSATAGDMGSTYFLGRFHTPWGN